MINNHHKYISVIQAISDAISLTIMLIITYQIRFSNTLHLLFTGRGMLEQHIGLTPHLNAFIVAIPIYILIYYLNELYSFDNINLIQKEKQLVFKSNIIVSFILLAIMFIRKDINYSRWLIVLFTVTSVFATIISRKFIRYIFRRFSVLNGDPKKFIVIGAGQLGQNFASKLSGNMAIGAKVIGFLDDFKVNKTYHGAEIIGKSNELESVINKFPVDEIIIALPLSAYDKIGDIINKSDLLGVKASIIPAYQKYLPTKPKIEHLDDIPIIGVRYIPLESALNSFSKRWFDILFSTFAIILSTPILIVIAILVKITSTGPIIYKQTRVGINRHEFSMLKFRTMKVQSQESGNSKWTTENDPRKTGIGNILRRTSLDELPQLFNVLVGDMSIVGPRPERPFFVKKYQEVIPNYMIKHHVRPGITGLAQVNGWRGDTSIEKRIYFDLKYIEDWDFALDIHIIIKTFFTGFINKNAY